MRKSVLAIAMELGAGREHIRERMQVARTKTAFWQDFTFLNP